MATQDDTDERDIEVEVLPPQTVRDCVELALEMGDLDEVMQCIRKIHPAKEIRNSLSKLQHQEPVNELLHVRRVALDIYAKEHDLTTSTLLVEIEGVGGRADPHRSEREKLRKAKKAVSKVRNLRNGAEALAYHWIAESKGKDPRRYIKSVKPLTV